MIKNKARDAQDNQGQQNYRSHLEIDSNLKILSQKRENADMEIGNNKKGCTQVESHQKGIQGVSRGVKRMFLTRNRKIEGKVKINGKFLDRNRRSDKTARTDKNEIGKIRERNRFFQSQKVKIRSASRQKYAGNERKPGSFYKIITEKLGKPSRNY